MSNEIYALSEMPPLGTVPRRMLASLVRPERYGRPITAFKTEEVETPRPGPNQVLVYVMAAGVNYNNVWASMGKPVDVIGARNKRGEPEKFHIGGSDASGIVWAVGEGVTRVKVGDRVVLSCCRWDRNDPVVKAGEDPMFASSVRVWGYEDNWGSFAQYTLVDELQCFPKPQHLSWEAAAAYMLVGATAYRQLLGWEPNIVKKDTPVLIWGGAGGLGCMAIQLVREFGGRAVAVVSDDTKIEYCKKLGAVGALNRKSFNHWGRLPDFNDNDAFGKWAAGARTFGKAFWDVLGEKRNPKIVFEHVGQDTIPTSIFTCETGGMVVICGGTSGYAADVDLRYLWMRQKRLQGSHFANVEQCAAFNTLMCEKRIDPCLSRTLSFEEVGLAHELMRDNKHPPGNMSVLVNAKEPGQKDV